MEQSQVTRRFKVEKYGELPFSGSEPPFLPPPENNKARFSSVLPKFEVTIETADQVSVGQEEIDVDVCAKLAGFYR